MDRKGSAFLLVSRGCDSACKNIYEALFQAQGRESRCIKEDQRTGLLYVWEPHASSGGCTDPDTGEPTGGCPNDRTSEQCVDAGTWQDYAVSGSIAAAG